jgi:hypothetical protein
MCEMMARPELTQIGDSKPEFSWIVGSAGQGGRQAAYQILVTSDRESLDKNQGNLWDSGKTLSARSVGIEYSGKPLLPDAAYFWKVRAWHENGEAGPYSQAQTFRTGTLDGRYETTRYPLTATMVRPLRIVRKAEGHDFIDFGKAAFGTVELTLTSPEAGRKVEVHLGEVPAGSDAIDRNPGGSRRYRMMTLTLHAGKHTYRVPITPDKRNTGPQAVRMPESVGEVMPFRYCELVNSPSEIDPSSIQQVAVHYPFDDEASRFTSSDPVLNDVWELCKYSMKATSFLGLYVDGDRERIPYEADAYINQLGHYGCDREFSMARRTLEYLIHAPTWPTEWCLFTPLMAWADYLHTGDPALIERHYDDLKAKALLSLARPDGLISTQNMPAEVITAIHLLRPLQDIVDWPQAERDGYDFRPINTVVNSFHYRAVVLLARMAKALKKESDGRELRTHAAKVKDAMMARLFDPARELFVDGEGSDHVSLHANLFPLAFGVVRNPQAQSIARYLSRRGMVCSVYAAQFLLEALYRAGAGDAALALLTSTAERSWAHMVYDVGSTITLEAWDNRFKPNQDWNHAWGAAPANLIPLWLMGVRPVEPGFGRMLIHPQPGSLAYAELNLPTISGPVRVRFNQEPGRSFSLETDIPANTSARVLLPRFGRADTTVLVDGVTVAATPDGDSLTIDGVGSGPHTLASGA